MAENMKLKATSTYPETRTPYSLRIYTSEILQQAFNDKAFQEMNANKAIPVFSDTSRTQVVGFCSATLTDKTVELDIDIIDKSFEDLIKAGGLPIACTFAGQGKVNDVGIVESLSFEGAHFSMLNNLNCKVMVQE